MAGKDETDEIECTERIVKAANTLRCEVGAIYEGWKERYAARAALIKFMSDDNVTTVELRDALMELL